MKRDATIYGAAAEHSCNFLLYLEQRGNRCWAEKCGMRGLDHRLRADAVGLARHDSYDVSCRFDVCETTGLWLA